MPSIPHFHVTQDPQFVYVHVHVPYIRVSDTEYYLDGNNFTFYCKPYLLKLQFPHEIVDNELAKAVYDPLLGNGTIVIHLPKMNSGTVFKDLDLLTRLLQPSKSKFGPNAKPKSSLIEVIDTCNTPLDVHEPEFKAGISESSCPITSTDDSLLQLEKIIEHNEQENSCQIHLTDKKPYYGFNNAYSDVLSGWHGEITEIIDLPDPEKTPANLRKVLREIDEDGHFDVERYVVDFVQAHLEEDEYYRAAMAFQPFWRCQGKLGVTQATDPRGLDSSDELLVALSRIAIDCTDEEIELDRDLLIRLPNKEFLIDVGSKEERLAFGGLADILFAFTYDHLTNEGDVGIESAWTISTLSSTLSWLDSSDNVDSIVRTSMRRMISFPLLRQYKLAQRVFRETVALFNKGKRFVLAALLKIYRIFETSEVKYLLNTIYIQDYSIWIQAVQESQLAQFTRALTRTVDTFCKNDCGFALDEMEKHALNDLMTHSVDDV